MGNAASKAGWVIFIVALIGAACRSGQDDPITADLKAQGVYQTYLGIMSIFICLALIWAAFLMRKSAKMHRHLNQSRRKGR